MKFPDEHLSDSAGLSSLAVRVGARSNLVQGAGGNISFKNSDTLWVKASGTRLKDAGRQNIFVAMDLPRTRKEVLQREDLGHLCFPSNTDTRMRPSIETAIHALLPHPYVLHVHSVGAISKSISRNFVLEPSDVHFTAAVSQIGYHKPGIPLAKAILENLGSGVFPEESLLVLMGNHGMIAAGDSAQAVLDIVLEAEKVWNVAPSVSASRISTDDGNVQVFSPGVLDEAQRQTLLGGVLTPDEAVFLGSQPFGPVRRELEPPSTVTAAVESDGSVWVRDSISEDALEIVESFVRVARNVSHGIQVTYLSRAEVGEILGWEAEKWRQATRKI